MKDKNDRRLVPATCPGLKRADSRLGFPWESHPRVAEYPRDTAGKLLNMLWRLLNVPSVSGALSVGQRKALELIFRCRGGEEFVALQPEEELERLLQGLRNSAHVVLLKKTRAKVNAAALATVVAFLIMRGPRYANRTEDERRFYWREGYWPGTNPTHAA